ncbi:MAG TPA: 2-amino-4-hydroxy-6-hydroxymethyldihydropteridine diphosphokinase, partial [Thermoanaerobaculia bacterium]|nr:2-amino-4-hydroxy-6-hydroxymethyldihydropteridine diphosphokinase [Thermoanaerobaculia bacterium]
MVEAIVSLGSNVEPRRNLPAAARLLAERTRVLAASSPWETAPVGPSGQPTFLNAALLIVTDLPAARLKSQVLREVERQLGRERGGDRYAPRPIDLDLTAYGRELIRLDGRELPDPELVRHVHLALPASEVAPDWVHPATGETLAALAGRLLAAVPPASRPRRIEDIDLRAEGLTRLDPG